MGVPTIPCFAQTVRVMYDGFRGVVIVDGQDQVHIVDSMVDVPARLVSSQDEDFPSLEYCLVPPVRILVVDKEVGIIGQGNYYG